MILIISTCQHKLHELEFVKPIQNAVKIESTIVHYKDLNQDHINNAKKIIICGTALKDNEYLDHLEKFDWISSYTKPILGICAGFQILTLTHGSTVQKQVQIGMTSINSESTLLKEIKEVYNLHQNTTSVPKEFTTIAISGQSVQAVQHNILPHIGLIFHPEVNNKVIIERFINDSA